MSAALPLAGLGVVITRPLTDAQALAAELAAAGARPIVFPALAIEPVDRNPALDAALGLLPGCALAIFVSANAVEHGLALARAAGPWPPAVRVAAIGEATARALAEAGFADVIHPCERNDSEALLERPELRAVQGAPIIVFRGEGGRELLKQELEARGARVAYAEVYRRARPATDPGPLLAAWDRGEVEVVGAMSAQTLENFVAMIGPEGRKKLAATTLVVPHEAIAAHADARRFGRVLVSKPGADSLATALAALRSAP